MNPQTATTYGQVDSPLGQLLVALTDVGVVAVGLPSTNEAEFTAMLRAKLGAVTQAQPEQVALVAAQLAEYFAGIRRQFDLPLDWRLTTGFARTVQQHLTTISYGQTQSYTQVATAVGNPLAVRAVGSACAANPLPILAPCHRVLRSDGTLGGYAGGLTMKQALLDLERSKDL